MTAVQEDSTLSFDNQAKEGNVKEFKGSIDSILE